MDDIKKENDELSEKIKKGLDLTFKKLLKEKREKDQSFVFLKDGKIIQIRARDFKEGDGM